MTDVLPSLTAEQRRIVAGQYERANQAIANGDHDYAIQLLMSCCKIDPGNLVYRKALRQMQRAKFKNNQRGERFAAVLTAAAKLRLQKAYAAGQYTKVLEIGEEILSHNPWSVSTLMAMALAFDNLDMPEAGVWSLDLARQKDPNNLKVNRALARLLEKTGHFTHANALWAFIRKADPKDEEAQRKVKELAANETISRGKYESVLDTESHSLDQTGPVLPAALGKEQLSAKDRAAREIENLQAKIEQEPRSVSGYLQLAAAYRRREQWDKVRETLQKGLAAAGNAFELAVELAEADIQPFRADLASAEAKLQANPNDPQLLELRVQLLREIHNRELDIFRRKADRYPTDMSHRLEMGVRLLMLGQLDEAISQLQLARTDPRIQWKALMYLGLCFKARNNWRLAQRNFEDALKQMPPSEETRRKEVLYQLAQGCADAGDLSAALEWGYELANEDFGYKDIGRRIDEWQGRLQGA